MSKHLGGRRTRSRSLVLGASALAVASVATATVALGQSGDSTGPAAKTSADVAGPRTYAGAGTARSVVRTDPSGLTLACTAGVT